MNDSLIGFEDGVSLEIAGFGGELSLRVHGRHDFEAVANPNFIVFLSMARRDMHGSGSLVLGHEFTKNHLRIAIHPRMPTNDAFQFQTGPGASSHFIILEFKPDCFHNVRNQLLV